MEGDGKIPKDDTSVDDQKPLPPLKDDDIDIMEQADISTGYNCLRLVMVNQFINKRLNPAERAWLYAEFRKQTIALTRNAVKRSENPLQSDSHSPNKRQIKEVEFELQMTKTHTGDMGFLTETM